ncbi:hypothetical protein [Pseudomonas caspiana]|uniref:2OG-Fe(II) oxygenase n=1 Tax=Pseudomonas caspiana TaxID=1451454 RepID=A0A1Y3P4N6_9PSED|nr:hypothetical protein [Pseudomonas caspiana]OUM74749.1 hypothetical protein AUC60_04970 [Pseudomonas caspiana]
MDSLVKEYAYRAIKSAQLVTAPFPHIYVEKVLPDDFYSELLLKLPPDDDYDVYPAPYEQRHFIQLSPSRTQKLTDAVSLFWKEFEAWIHSQEFLDVLVEKFGRRLKVNHKYREKDLVKNSVSEDDVRVSPRSLLVRDYQNFALGPHTDSESKFIVGAFYFPKDDTLRDFGTSIYVPKDPGVTSWSSPHMKHEDFHLVKTFENRPNTMLVFMKTDHSWHGVERKQHSNVGRDVLFWIPQIGAAAGAEIPLQLSKKWFSKPSFTDRVATKLNL